MVARLGWWYTPPSDWRFSSSEASPMTWNGGIVVVTVPPTTTSAPPSLTTKSSRSGEPSTQSVVPSPPRGDVSNDARRSRRAN